MKQELVKKSRYCSKLLRHNPDGLKMDKNGWVTVSDLIQKVKITKEELDHIVENNNKKRFIYNEDESKIRANQGHTIDVDVQLKEAIPPKELYHGTSPNTALIIFREGLKPMKRNHVHLSADIETAENVGSRHCSKGTLPAIIIVETELLLKTGHKFYLSENGVWLTNEISAKYLTEYKL